ncbi:hypothetical protein PIB30_104168, partial [Stylosanthes scabra]|nr:hypothetical protein [Stylosanthes scabra]
FDSDSLGSNRFNQSMDQPVNWSRPFNYGQQWSMAVNTFFSSGSSQEVKRLYTDFSISDHRKLCGPIYEHFGRKY